MDSFGNTAASSGHEFDVQALVINHADILTVIFLSSGESRYREMYLRNV